MKAVWNGVVVAESEQTVIVEGNHYFPPESLKREHTTFSNHRTGCVWKGQAQWLSLMGHLIYGLVTSFVFIPLVKRG